MASARTVGVPTSCQKKYWVHLAPCADRIKIEQRRIKKPKAPGGDRENYNRVESKNFSLYYECAYIYTTVCSCPQTWIKGVDSRLGMVGIGGLELVRGLAIIIKSVIYLSVYDTYV